MSPSSWGRLSMVPTALAGPVALLAPWMGLCLGKKSLSRTGLGRLNAHQQYNQIRSRPHSNRNIFFGEGWCSGKFRGCRGKMLISGLSSITAQTKLSTLSSYWDLSGHRCGYHGRTHSDFPQKGNFWWGLWFADTCSCTLRIHHSLLANATLFQGCSQTTAEHSRVFLPSTGLLSWAVGALGLPSLASTLSCTGVWGSSYSTLFHLLSPLGGVRTALHSAEAPACSGSFSPLASREFSPIKLSHTNFHLSFCFSEDLNWHGQCADICYFLPTPYIFPLLIGMQSPHKPNHLIGELLFFNPKHEIMVDC